MSRILVIGYGNPLRGDDGLGWHAAERLRERLHHPDIEILAVHQLTPELMEPISRAERVVFLDACAGPAPGEMRERSVERLMGGSASFTHHITPEALLGGAHALYGRAAAGNLVSVAGAEFSCTDELSPVVSSRLNDVVAAVLRLIAPRGAALGPLGS